MPRSPHLRLKKVLRAVILRAMEDLFRYSKSPEIAFSLCGALSNAACDIAHEYRLTTYQKRVIRILVHELLCKAMEGKERTNAALSYLGYWWTLKRPRRSYTSRIIALQLILENFDWLYWHTINIFAHDSYTVIRAFDQRKHFP